MKAGYITFQCGVCRDIYLAPREAYERIMPRVLCRDCNHVMKQRKETDNA